MKTWTPDTYSPLADYHRGQLNDQVKQARVLFGDDMARRVIKVLGTRQTPLTSADYLRLLGKSEDAIAYLESLTAPRPGASTKGKRKKPKEHLGNPRQDRGRVLATSSGESDVLASQAQGFENRARRFRPGPFQRPAPATKAARREQDALLYYAAGGNRQALALLLNRKVI